MAKTKVQKKELLEKLSDIVGKSKTLVFVNFKGLTVFEVNEFRRKLRAEGTTYTVAKKTILRRALDAAKFTGEVPELKGEVGIALGADQLAPARGVHEYAKTHKEHLSIVGGVFDGAFRDKAFMLSIATIPPREVLLAQFVNLINSPIQRFAVALSEIAKKKQ